MLGDQRITVINNGETIAIKFDESERYYNIAKNDIIEQFTLHIDTTPGVLAQNDNGEYMVESIEDLVVLSAAANGGYSDENITVAAFDEYSTYNIMLIGDLDFKSPLSYADSKTNKYNGYLGVEDTTITLMEALTNIKDYKGFIPIGRNGFKFSVKFDGKGYEIKNLYVNNEESAGLFGYVSHGAEISNLTVTGEINSTTYAGGIVGYSVGEITNCTNYAKVSGSSAGGICGYWGAGKINNSINCGEVFASASGGGIVGYNYNSGELEVNCCINTGYISALNAGGIMGSKGSQSVTFNSCLNAEDAQIMSTGSESGVAGGIVGKKENPVEFHFYNCANLGLVSGYYSGGILGDIDWWGGDTLANCFGGGKITGDNAGGIFGCAYAKDTAYNCYHLLTDSIAYSVGKPLQDNVDSEGITEVNKTLVDSLNGYIEENEDGINTTGWKKWTLNKKGNLAFAQ